MRGRYPVRIAAGSIRKPLARPQLLLEPFVSAALGVRIFRRLLGRIQSQSPPSKWRWLLRRDNFGDHATSIWKGRTVAYRMRPMTYCLLWLNEGGLILALIGALILFFWRPPSAPP